MGTMREPMCTETEIIAAVRAQPVASSSDITPGVPRTTASGIAITRPTAIATAGACTDHSDRQRNQ